MSIETELKKLTAAVVQLTDAINDREIPKQIAKEILDTEVEPGVVVETDTVGVNTGGTGGTAEPEPKPELSSEAVFNRLREIAGEMGDAGTGIVQLMGEYGATSVSKIDPKHYPELLVKAEALLWEGKE